MSSCNRRAALLTFSSVKFEDAAREMADEVTKPRPLGEEEVQDIQITLKSDANPMNVRDLRVCFNTEERCKFNLLLLLLLLLIIIIIIIIINNNNN